MFGSTKTLISGAKRRSYRCRTRVDNGKKTINEQGEVFGCNSDIVYEDVLKECLKSILKEVIKDKEKIISDEVCKSLVDKVIVHSKADFDFYLKGNQGEYFKRKGVLLYNNHGKI